MADMTVTEARKRLAGLLDKHNQQEVRQAFRSEAGARDSPLGPEDVADLNDIVATLDGDEVARKLGIDEDARGIEETPTGAAAVNDAARGGFGVNYPVTMYVEVTGQPGNRSIEVVPQDYDGPGVDDLEPALEQNFPRDRAGDDPVSEFISAVGSAVGDAFPRELDDLGFAGRVGSVRVRSDGSFTFAPGEDPAEAFEQTQQSEPGFERTERSGFEGRGTNRPTNQRPNRGQQTLSEAGTRESLSEFAEGTVEDDPDEVIGPSDEVRRQARAATTGGERTQSAGEGLGRFARIEGTIRATLYQDEPTQRPTETGEVEEIPGAKVVSPWIVFGDGPAAQYGARSDLESAIYQAANVEGMFDFHGEGATITLGKVVFVDGGDTVSSVEFNDNWVGDDVDADTYEQVYQV